MTVMSIEGRAMRRSLMRMYTGSTTKTSLELGWLNIHCPTIRSLRSCGFKTIHLQLSYKRKSGGRKTVSGPCSPRTRLSDSLLKDGQHPSKSLNIVWQVRFVFLRPRWLSSFLQCTHVTDVENVHWNPFRIQVYPHHRWTYRTK